MLSTKTYVHPAWAFILNLFESFLNWLLMISDLEDVLNMADAALSADYLSGRVEWLEVALHRAVLKKEVPNIVDSIM